MENETKTTYTGKTKDVLLLTDGTRALRFKDDVTGINGKHDPGQNQVGLTVDGMGNVSIRTSVLFFELLEENGISTHYNYHNLSENLMGVEPVDMLPLEFICRRKAVGSLRRRYGKFFRFEQDLDYLFEVTTKDDSAGDPMINEDQLIACGLLKEGDYDILKDLTQKITKILEDFLAEKDIVLYDIKFEFGVDKDGNFILADDISPSCMRCYRYGIKLELLELAAAILS